SIGQEFGATTRRPRRCGWFDGVAARFAAEVAGFTHLAVMKMDVFDTFETIRLVVAYRLDGRTLQTVPHTAAMARVEPVYEEFPGWRCPTTGARHLTDLPVEARAFLRRIEEIVGAPLALVGVGRERRRGRPLPAPRARVLRCRGYRPVGVDGPGRRSDRGSADAPAPGARRAGRPAPRHRDGRPDPRDPGRADHVRAQGGPVVRGD